MLKSSEKIRKLFFYCLIFCVFTAIATIYSCLSAGKNFSEEKWLGSVEKSKVSDLYASHKKDGIFFNPWMKNESVGFFRVLKWKLSPSQKYTEKEKNYKPERIDNVPYRIRKTDGDFVLWIGHNTFLLRIDGNYWLTDPMFSKRALFPKRKTKPAMTIDELVKIVKKPRVIITHNHYDHFDTDTIEKLPEDSVFYVPLGLKKSILKLKKSEIHEMDWWGEKKIGRSEKLIALPAQHWSLRIGEKRNSSLWASFLLKTENYNIYFAGDSGYYVGFREIGRKYPGIDYAFMPTTAYHPRWFMHYQHMDIKENLKAFKELGAKFFIPTQWGTFHLADEPVGFPAMELEKEIKKQNLKRSRFKILKLGEILPLKPVLN